MSNIIVPTYSFKHLLNKSQFNYLINKPAPYFPNETYLGNKCDILIYNPSYNENNWTCCLQTYKKLKAKKEVEVLVYINNPSKDFKLPKFFDYNLEIKNLPFLNLYDKLEYFTILYNKKLEKIDIHNYINNRYNKSSDILEKINWSYYKRNEEEKFIDHFIWCNLPYEEYIKPMYYSDVQYDFSIENLVFDNINTPNVDWNKFLESVSKDGLKTILNFELDFSGGINQCFLCSHRLFAEKVLKIPYIPSLLMLRQYKNQNDFIKYGKYTDKLKSEWIINKIQPYLTPDIIFIK